MIDMSVTEVGLISTLIAVLLLNSFTTLIIPAHAAISIELEEFRWNRFPISVYVEMNQWSILDYAPAIREGLDNWLKAIWNYTNAYDGQSLAMISYTYYVKDINSTGNPDVIISFAPYEMSGKAVGLTTYKYDDTAHEPITPIIINITTHSATETDLFVKNVAMHEFGHALGVGHASSPNTENGPELMYYASSKSVIIFPSTLDVYALTQIYQGHFGQTTQLPSSVPYVMLPEGAIPPTRMPQWQTYLQQYVPPIAVAAIFLLLSLTVVAYVTRRKTDASRSPPILPPPPTDSNSALRAPELQVDNVKTRFSKATSAKTLDFRPKRAEACLW
jgi:hypothetical protein